MKLVVLTGAGISAESGLKTFRDADGLWEGYNIYDVATPEAWERNPELVQQFYNERRMQVLAAQPNAAHFALATLERNFDVEIITQNIDDLHERAGSTKVTHLHGIITKSQSDLKSNHTYPIQGAEIKMGELCEFGSQLRPHVVWFGEAVPMIEVAAEICMKADIFVLIGTSLAVYPAAGLIDFVPPITRKYIIDPKTPDVRRYKNVVFIEKNAIEGMEVLQALLSDG
ncbi:NAD-dependent deacetylase [Pedobacter psychrotolerans]|uniref:protein acetyllysine N-acetyltransferase n=1 Tax=Pedobacter psychrotolerans TaxID=1843235 RepID=A0A4R2H897_9SPHI|nr:Sir2 family NAD-dependent protein deacetylase [Pedobacter psychrotolerans]TCO22421.1 NAD-dependent deacetylase [Pedobacter psychrotolerans]GGE64471.1 NAD-dependent protein deacylase [Pedobacter psychrotolerans]